MKYSPRFTYTFTPSTNTLNLSSNSGFNISGLLAVIDSTNPTLIYAVASSGLGYSALSGGNILTLQYNCSALSASDNLIFIYDDGLAGSASIIGSPTQIAANPQIVAQNSFWGQLKVTQDPSELLIDTFDSISALDTSVKWTTGGSVAPTQTGGSLVVSPGTTASASSYLISKPSFAVSAQSYISSANILRIDTGTTTNNYRFFGFGTLPGTIAATTPLYDAIGFEIDTSGNLNCVIWSAGTKTFTQNITRPTDGFFHKYTTYMRGARMFWQIDNNDVYSAQVSLSTTNISGPSSFTLPELILSINATTAPSSAPTFVHNSASVADYGKNNMSISDGVYGFRMASIGPKNTQGTFALNVQDQKDTGRVVTNYYMNIPVVTTATDALQSLTGYKNAATVTATTTPVVVTTGKTYRITAATITYVAIATAGTAKFTLRANTAGTVAIGSPAVQSWIIGGPAATAGVSQTVHLEFLDGIEFAAGTGIGISMYGLGATQAAAAVGYASISLLGFEY